MGDFHPQCPKCNSLLARGHIPDVAHGAVLESSWAPGDAQSRKFLGGIKYQRDELIPLVAFRCPSCGFVELYAQE